VTGTNRKWWTLAAVSFGLFMIMLDNTVVNVALPSIERDLGARQRSASGPACPRWRSRSARLSAAS
jgi:MFS family permease